METMASESARRIATEICFNMCFPREIRVLSYYASREDRKKYQLSLLTDPFSPKSLPVAPFARTLSRLQAKKIEPPTALYNLLLRTCFQQKKLQLSSWVPV